MVGEHQLVVLANRLPIERTDTGWGPSPGGLVRALFGALRERHGVWIGWTGGVDDDGGPDARSEGVALLTVPLSGEQIHGYYESVSNGAIWPLYHDALRSSVYDADSWQVYRDVNREFAERAARAAAPGAAVWVHDYHLQLVPAMLREMRPDLRIGFFLHIPFPPQELFMRMPWREEIIEGMLGADVIGFQRQVAAENFVGLTQRLLHAEHDATPPNGIRLGEGSLHTVHAPNGREVVVGTFPVSIDFADIAAMGATEETQRAAAQIRLRLGEPDTVLLGVDRLDYTKGIVERLIAFRTLLAQRAASDRTTRPSIVLVQLAVPSRESVEEYQDQRVRVEELVGNINGEYATLGYPAVHYLHLGVPLERLVALYRAADVMVVTPLRDGMNLVAKEFAAARADGGGVLLLSEFAGAADELTDAVIVNPHDGDALVAAMAAAVDMPKQEARERMRGMRRAVAANDAEHWAATFLAQLDPTA